MGIITIGLNFETAPVEMRERLAFAESDLPEAMVTLNNNQNILENIIISTCNRTEIYAVVDDLADGCRAVKQFLYSWFHFEDDEINHYLYTYEDEVAIEHLFKVTCGLNSMILGETQILGQVRKSFLLAQQQHVIGPIFNQLVKQALTIAKRAHSETAIGENAVSVSYAAVELAKKRFGSLHNRQILVIGAGKMGELAIEHLHANGADQMMIISRTFERAEQVAKKFNVQVSKIEQLQNMLNKADLVISSTNARGYIITKELLDTISDEKEMLLIDLAVPRDIDPDVRMMKGKSLYDIDDLEGIVQFNLDERKKAAQEVMLMIKAEIIEFDQWTSLQKVTPIIAALREKALHIQATTMSSIENKMPNLSEREKKILNKHTTSILNQLLKDPILQLKELSDDEQSVEKIALFKQIFSLDEEVEMESIKTSVK